MELNIPIESLKLDLKCIEQEITQLSPIPCRNDLDLRDLLISRDQIKAAIKILEDKAKIVDKCLMGYVIGLGNCEKCGQKNNCKDKV